MLLGTLIHPPLMRALAAAGHGSKILLADGNYSHSTGAENAVERIYLNLRPGLLDVDQVLDAVLASVPIEEATVMIPDDDTPVPAHAGFRERLKSDISWQELGRFDFYDACRSPDLALLVATGDQRIYTNLLLTIGVRA